MLGDNRLTAALIDRLMHHSHIVIIRREESEAIGDAADSHLRCLSRRGYQPSFRFASLWLKTTCEDHFEKDSKNAELGLHKGLQKYTIGASLLCTSESLILNCADWVMHFFEPFLCTFYLTNTPILELLYNIILFFKFISKLY